MDRRLTRRRVIAGAALATVLATPSLAQQTAFQLGVIPNVSARVILTSYQPMKVYLERELGRTVEIATAPDFRMFHQRTLEGSFDMVVTAANLGRVAEQAGRPEAFAIYEPAIPALLVMHASRPVTAIGELRGKTLALSNPQSLVALRGLGWLREQGLTPNTDVTLVHARNDDSLGQLLVSGEAPLALMSGGEFRAIREELRANLRVFQEVTRVPGFYVMPGKPIADADRERLTRAMLAFPASPEGQEFIRLTGFQGIRAIQAADRTAVDPVTDETRRQLSAP